jgi:glycosyltransferase involved in cell wall biosynthesis
MRKTNWIIIRSVERGSDYGVGSFIRHFSKELAKRESIRVIILEIGCNNSPIVQVNEKERITYLRVRYNGVSNGTDSISNQTKIGRNITRAISTYIPNAKNSLVHINFSYQIFIGLELSNLLRGKLIFTQHITPIVIGNDTGPDKLETEIYRAVDKIVTVTENGKRYLINRSAPPEKLVTIYNGIESKCFLSYKKDVNIRKKYGIKDKEKIVLYSGRLEESKGLQFLLESFHDIQNQLSDCRLVLAGDGDFKWIVELSRYFSSQINILGFLPYDDLLLLYQEATIGVIPSLQEECSYVALEMLHSGLPVVASKVGGLKEIFTDQKDGFLVDMFPKTKDSHVIQPDVNQLGDRMLQLLTDEDIRKEMKQFALSKAKSMFTAQEMVKKYEEVVN